MRERETATEIEKRLKEASKTVKRGFDNLVKEMKLGHTDRYLDYLSFVSRFHRYSHFNQMLIFSQKPDATLVAGYRKWQEMGYQVNKGERGIKILAPIFVKQEEEDEYGQLVSLQKLVGYKIVKVFDASQLTDPVKDFWNFRKELPDDANKKYEIVKRAAETDTLKVFEKTMPRGYRGEAIAGAIYLKEGMDSIDRTNVLIHEWGHEILHLGPGKSEEMEQLPTAVRECQVESVAYIVSKSLGIDSQFSRDYLLHYGNTAETLIANMETIQKTSHYMIKAIEREILGK